MKNKIKEITSRDKAILVIFIFFLIFAGMYVLHGNLQEEKTVLQGEHSILETKRKTALESKMELKGLEKILGAKKEEMEGIYSKVPDNIHSSIDFETLFLGWIDGRNVKVQSFAYAKPMPERVIFENKDLEFDDSENGDPLGIIAGEVDNLQGVAPENEGTPEEPVVPNEDIEEGDETPPETTPQVEAPSIDFARFSYKLELSRYEYTRLLDKVNNKSEFYHLESTDFNESDEGPGNATFDIKVYAFSKPKNAKSESN